MDVFSVLRDPEPESIFNAIPDCVSTATEDSAALLAESSSSPTSSPSHSCSSDMMVPDSPPQLDHTSPQSFPVMSISHLAGVAVDEPNTKKRKMDALPPVLYSTLSPMLSQNSVPVAMAAIPRAPAPVEESLLDFDMDGKAA